MLFYLPLHSICTMQELKQQQKELFKIGFKDTLQRDTHLSPMKYNWFENFG